MDAGVVNMATSGQRWLPSLQGLPYMKLHVRGCYLHLVTDSGMPGVAACCSGAKLLPAVARRSGQWACRASHARRRLAREERPTHYDTNTTMELCGKLARNRPETIHPLYTNSACKCLQGHRRQELHTRPSALAASCMLHATTSHNHTTKPATYTYQLHAANTPQPRQPCTTTMYDSDRYPHRSLQACDSYQSNSKYAVYRSSIMLPSGVMT